MRLCYLRNAVEESQRKFGDWKRRIGFEWDLNKQWGEKNDLLHGPEDANKCPGAGLSIWLGTGHSRWLELGALERRRRGWSSVRAEGSGQQHFGPHILPRKPDLKLYLGILVLRQTTSVWSCPSLLCPEHCTGCCGVFESIVGPKMIFWVPIPVRKPPLTIKTSCRLGKDASGPAAVDGSHGRMCG